MNSNKELLKNIIEGILEKKGRNISSIDLTSIQTSSICDHFVICEGNTPTQVSSIADSVEKMVREATGEKPIRVQGQQLAEWIAIDYGTVIVHVFLPDLRGFYNIDHLWADAKIEKIADEVE